MKHYVYYSYEEWGRGYIGVKTSEDPDNDGYFGSFTDLSFQPTHKIVIAEFPSREEAQSAEIILHEYFEVSENPHFANLCQATSTGFYQTPEECRTNGSKGGIKSVESKRNQGIPVFNLSHARRKELTSKAGIKTRDNELGIHAPGNQSKGGKAVSAQKWRCLVTGFVGPPGTLATYQKARGIDPSLRERLA